MFDFAVWGAVCVSLITGALALLSLALRPVLGRVASPRFLTALWALLALRLLLPFTLPLPDTAVLFQFTPPEQIVLTSSPPAEPESDTIPAENAGEAVFDLPLQNEPDSQLPTTGGTAPGYTQAVTQSMPANEDTPEQPDSGWWSGFFAAFLSLSPAVLIFIVWIVGAVVKLVFDLSAAALLRRSLCHQRAPVDDPWLLAQIDLAAAALRLKKRPAVWCCDPLPGPMLVGFFRPVLLLPSADRYTAEDWECMLRHELVHYRCHHMLYKFLFLMMCCVQWWNPAAYLLRRQADRDLELTCDSLALSGKTASYRGQYGRALLNSAAPRRRLGDSCSSCFHRSGTRTMRRRLLNILGKSGRRGSPAALALVLAFCLLTGCFVSPSSVPASSQPHSKGESEAEFIPAQSHPATIHEISTAEELVAFAQGVNSGELNSDSGDWWVLTNDIDLTGIDWQPIGATVSPISGNPLLLDYNYYSDNFYLNEQVYESPLLYFDGQGHTVCGLSCFQDVPYGMAGFFFTVASGSVIRNLNLEGTVIGEKAGGLIFRAAGLIENCSFSGQVIGYGDVGGLASSGVNATIRYCRVDADVAGGNTVGGLIGSTGTCDISSCYVTGTVSGYSDQQISALSGLTFSPDIGIIQQIGGFAGYGFGELPDCIADTELYCYDETRFLGSFVGTTNSNTISGCYYNNEKNLNWGFGTIQLRLQDGQLFDGPYPAGFRPTTIREDTPGWTPLGISTAEIEQRLNTMYEEYQPISTPLDQAQAVYQPRDFLDPETHDEIFIRRNYLDWIADTGALEVNFSAGDISSFGPTEERGSLTMALYRSLVMPGFPESHLDGYDPQSPISEGWLPQQYPEETLLTLFSCTRDMVRAASSDCYDAEQGKYYYSYTPPAQKTVLQVTSWKWQQDSTLLIDYQLYKVSEDASQTWQPPVLAGTGQLLVRVRDGSAWTYLSNEYTAV